MQNCNEIHKTSLPFFFQVLLRKPYTSAVDSWALGVITYILLSGTMPFDHEEKAVLYRTIIEGNYSFAGDVSATIRFTAQTLKRLFVVQKFIQS